MMPQTRLRLWLRHLLRYWCPKCWRRSCGWDIGKPSKPRIPVALECERCGFVKETGPEH